ncbi:MULTISPECIES: helix-turn-helix transcriptional regulator [Bradyrhizobium]|uniref:helix-turn-helix transcriptional regulator n=1 Tax=Bradyrhizobium elkanii TaxID=29448 RepID=UPI0003F56A1C|nr:AlpA family phage regulatory protein [Bradyrhizobium elkanii]
MIAAKGAEAETDDGAAAVSAGGGGEKSGPRRMLTEKQVLEIIPVGRTTLYRMEKAGRFPRSTYISANRRIWFEDEIIGWQNEVNGRGRGRRNHSGG